MGPNYRFGEFIESVSHEQEESGRRGHTRQYFDAPMTADFIQQEDDGLLIVVDLGLYSQTALKRVAYRFTNQCHVHMELCEAGKVKVRFRAKEQGDLNRVAGEFCNELLDQTLREEIARETEGARNLIMAHALSRTSVINEAGDSD